VWGHSCCCVEITFAHLAARRRPCRITSQTFKWQGILALEKDKLECVPSSRRQHRCRCSAAGRTFQGYIPRSDIELQATSYQKGQEHQAHHKWKPVLIFEDTTLHFEPTTVLSVGPVVTTADSPSAANNARSSTLLIGNLRGP